MFLPTIVIDGRVRGIWKRVIRKGRVAVTASPFDSLNKAEARALAAAAERYGTFLGLPVELSVEPPS
jgi:Winged helix DNA-binding domain